MISLLSLSDNSSDPTLACPPSRNHSHLNLPIFTVHLQISSSVSCFNQRALLPSSFQRLTVISICLLASFNCSTIYFCLPQLDCNSLFKSRYCVTFFLLWCMGLCQSGHLLTLNSWWLDSIWKDGTVLLPRTELRLWNHFPDRDKNVHRKSIIFNPAFLLTKSMHVTMSEWITSFFQPAWNRIFICTQSQLTHWEQFSDLSWWTAVSKGSQQMGSIPVLARGGENMRFNLFL